MGDSAYGTKANIESLRVQGIQAYLKRRASKTDRRGWLERMPEGCDPGVALAEMRRRLHTAEGRFAEAHVRYSHRRCRWRRRWRVQIQCYLVAAVQNVGKLIRYGLRPRPAVADALSTAFSLFSGGGDAWGGVSYWFCPNPVSPCLIRHCPSHLIRPSETT